MEKIAAAQQSSPNVMEDKHSSVPPSVVDEGENYKRNIAENSEVRIAF